MRRRKPKSPRKTAKPEPQEVLLGDKGRLVIPATFRRALGLKKGERMIVLIDDDGRLRLKTLDQGLDDVEGAYAHLAPFPAD